MKELPTGEFLVYDREDYENAIKEFLTSRMCDKSWRDKIDTVPKRYPSVCRFQIHTQFWDMTASIVTLKQYKAAAEKVWREIEAL